MIIRMYPMLMQIMQKVIELTTEYHDKQAEK